MELLALPPPTLAGHLFLSKIRYFHGLTGCLGYKWKKNSMVLQRLASRYMSLSAKRSAKDRKPSVVRSGGIDEELDAASSRKSFYDARVLYCVAAAMGHNKESHPESNKRVPAIVNALERLELTPKYRSREIYELQNIKPALLDDIAIVHSRSYIHGLEKEKCHLLQPLSL